MISTGNENAHEHAIFWRVRTIVITLGVLVCIWLLWAYGWKVAGAFVLGAVASSVNLLWMRKSTENLIEKMADPTPGGGGVIARFTLRFGLLALGAFVIIQSSAVNVYALVAGLALPISAFIMEAVYQGYLALKHGTDSDSPS